MIEDQALVSFVEDFDISNMIKLYKDIRDKYSHIKNMNDLLTQILTFSKIVHNIMNRENINSFKEDLKMLTEKQLFFKSGINIKQNQTTDDLYNCMMIDKLTYEECYAKYSEICTSSSKSRLAFNDVLKKINDLLTNLNKTYNRFFAGCCDFDSICMINLNNFNPGTHTINIKDKYVIIGNNGNKMIQLPDIPKEVFVFNITALRLLNVHKINTLTIMDLNQCSMNDYDLYIKNNVNKFEKIDIILTSDLTTKLKNYITQNKESDSIEGLYNLNCNLYFVDNKGDKESFGYAPINGKIIYSEYQNTYYKYDALKSYVFYPFVKDFANLCQYDALNEYKTCENIVKLKIIYTRINRLKRLWINTKDDTLLSKFKDLEFNEEFDSFAAHMNKSRSRFRVVLDKNEKIDDGVYLVFYDVLNLYNIPNKVKYVYIKYTDQLYQKPVSKMDKKAIKKIYIQISIINCAYAGLKLYMEHIEELKSDNTIDQKCQVIFLIDNDQIASIETLKDEFNKFKDIDFKLYNTLSIADDGDILINNFSDVLRGEVNNEHNSVDLKRNKPKSGKSLLKWFGLICAFLILIKILIWIMSHKEEE